MRIHFHHMHIYMVGVERSMSETARRTSKGRKNWRVVHLQRSKGEARRAEPTFGLCFCAKAAKEVNGEARRAEPMLWLW